LSKEELSFFKALIGAIVKKPDGLVDHNHCIIMGKDNGGLSASKATATIERLVAERWLDFR
jgi:hypothetical protein